MVRPGRGGGARAEARHHRAVKASYQKVSQQVRAGLALKQFADAAGPAEHVIAVQAAQPPDPEPGAQLVERTVTPAVRVAERHPPSAPPPRPRPPPPRPPPPLPFSI